MKKRKNTPEGNGGREKTPVGSQGRERKLGESEKRENNREVRGMGNKK